MRRIFAPAALYLALFSGAASPSLAQTKLTCQLKPGFGQWLPRSIELVGTGDKILVTDEIITKFKFLSPIKAKVAVDNARRTTYAWMLRDVVGQTPGHGGTQHFDVSYRLTIQKAGHEALLVASPHGRYSAADQTVGTCDGV